MMRSSLILLCALALTFADEPRKVDKRGLLPSYGANSGLSLGISSVTNSLPVGGLSTYGGYGGISGIGGFSSGNILSSGGLSPVGLSSAALGIPTSGFGLPAGGIGTIGLPSAGLGLAALSGSAIASPGLFNVGAAGLAGVSNTFSQSNQVVNVPSPYPVPVTINRQIPVPVPQAVPVVIPRPYNVPVPQPVPVFIPRPYTVNVPRPVSVPVPQKVAVPITRTVPVPIPQPYPVSVPQVLPVNFPQPFSLPGGVSFQQSPILSNNPSLLLGVQRGW